MDYFPHPVKFFVHLRFCFLQILLGEIDGIGKDAAPMLYPGGDAAVLQLHAFGLQEGAEVFIQFVFFEFFHVADYALEHCSKLKSNNEIATIRLQAICNPREAPALDHLPPSP